MEVAVCDAERPGFTLAEYFPLMLTGWRSSLLDEGVDRLANPLLGDYADDEDEGDELPDGEPRGLIPDHPLALGA